MGHEVQISGEYEYCLGCGRETKAKHSTSAKLCFGRREYSKPVARIKRYRKRKHDTIFEGWWACKRCPARGPGLNKKN
eukprot:3911508-Heterocapsa_arctica.AAC.1